MTTDAMPDTPGDQIWDWKQPKHCLAVKPGGGDFPARCDRLPGHAGRHQSRADGTMQTEVWDAMDRSDVA